MGTGLSKSINSENQSHFESSSENEVEEEMEVPLELLNVIPFDDSKVNLTSINFEDFYEDGEHHDTDIDSVENLISDDPNDPNHVDYDKLNSTLIFKSLSKSALVDEN